MNELVRYFGFRMEGNAVRGERARSIPAEPRRPVRTA